MICVGVIVSVLDTGTGWNISRVLATSPVTIGRDPENTIQLRHPDVARRHAEIAFGEDVLRICCLPGGRGASADDKTIGPNESMRLRDGATVFIGPYCLKIRMRAAEVEPGLTLGLALNLAPIEADAPAAEVDQRATALTIFASAFLILRRYAGSHGRSVIWTLEEPHHVVDYLVEPDAPADRLDELSEALAELVTHFTRLACPVERLPA